MARSDPRNRSDYWWDRHMTGLSLLRADFTTHAYPPHSHEAFVVAVTEAGGSVIRSRGVEEEAHRSELFVFNPAEPHEGWMGRSERWLYRSLYLTRDAIAALETALGVEALPYFLTNKLADPDLIEAFLALHRALEQGRDPFRERELLVGSFGVLFGRHGSGGGRIPPAPADRTRLARATALMHGRHGEALRLEEVAAEANLTVFQLIGLFKRTTGLTPHAFLTQVRLNAVCRLLRGDTPLAEVAAATGFYDQSAMTRHFKRCYGMTPRQFALAAQEGRAVMAS
ncbi:transcriptional regulator, AraC family [Tistlia consotensis]|uniref:Transcriptional regulator, AraC family n=1 Tax=Tistlia consotensis USBA 355 TaxID=560819 RepID=A0A1Y6BIF6_9PROT|nr:AraC family transcriptional regulator [Tistlia consotensis]SMF13003.1 transcriptional regulator, AraC family [Tistlia consotensis USBA 355]SNR50779.1 transcriptional regulator, AraC family [Tistlia consotensis]